MQTSKIKSIIKKGEGINIEFKECGNKLSKDVFETVCAFLNRFGGELLLGVKDNGRVMGVDRDKAGQLKKNFVTAINNPQKIAPTFYLNIEEVIIDNKVVLCIYVPESSQVHRCSGRIFDRNEDGDFDITDNSNLVTDLYIRKQTSYSENRIYPFITISDLRNDLIEKARKLAINQNPGHLWSGLDDFGLLKSAQLYLKDYRGGGEGFTLAAVLLFGKDEVLLSVLPHHRTDAILRIENLDRYDDRDDIRTNLIDSYERIMTFARKHLPDKYYLENEQRISLRDHIIREVASNTLIHREYNNPFPAKFIIERARIYTENSNKPHGYGLINPANFSPFPKNPVIAKFFKEIGRADELGSGVRNLFKYCNIYSGKKPQLIEEDIFKTIIPLPKYVVGQVTGQVPGKYRASTEQVKILRFCKEPRLRSQIQKHLRLKHREYFRAKILGPLIDSGFIKMTIPDKPQSSKQKYVITDKGRRVLEK